jgi:hypothetical protein
MSTSSYQSSQPPNYTKVINYLTLAPLEHFTQSRKPDDWIDRKISNFEYLMWLNFVSGRSYQDLTQYPVLPWIFIGFETTPDLNASNSYRDLMKNMGTVGA